MTKQTVTVARRTCSEEKVATVYANLLGEGFKVLHVLAVPENGMQTRILMIGVKTEEKEDEA